MIVILFERGNACFFFIQKIQFIHNRREEIMVDGGVLMDIELQETYQERALVQLQADADKIAQLIKVQMDHLTMPQCPLYEEVLDTQMYGLSREIDFAVKLGLIERFKGNEILSLLEKEMTVLHEIYTKK